MAEAPYPADTRAKGWRFELDHERIQQSDTWALAPAEVRPWLLMLWMTAWVQEPCGSLPKDDLLIAVRIGMPIKSFNKNRDALMRGWWLAEDGRQYHDLLIEQVGEMLTARARGWLAHRAEVINRCGARCWYCGCEGMELTLDHVIPRSRGGSDDPANLVPACRPCNSSKGARTPEEWQGKQ